MCQFSEFHSEALIHSLVPIFQSNVCILHGVDMAWRFHYRSRILRQTLGVSANCPTVHTHLTNSASFIHNARIYYLSVSLTLLNLFYYTSSLQITLSETQQDQLAAAKTDSDFINKILSMVFNRDCLRGQPTRIKHRIFRSPKIDHIRSRQNHMNLQLLFNAFFI